MRALLSVGLSLTGLAFGQEPIRKTEESFIPSYVAANASYLWGSRADLKDYDGASMAQQEAGALAQYPVYRSERARFTVGVRYRWTQLDFAGNSPFGDAALDLHRVQIPLNSALLAPSPIGCERAGARARGQPIPVTAQYCESVSIHVHLWSSFI